MEKQNIQISQTQTINVDNEEHISTRYTLVPILDPDHQKKLQIYMAQPTQPKTSFCRFYLRGICIMKPHLCKFAHQFQSLLLEQDDQQLLKDCNYTQKQRKKKYFQSKQDFQQKPLFILKNVDYAVLHKYQFQDKWKNSIKCKQIYTIQQIKADHGIRHKIREVLHRQNWQKLIDYLIKEYTNVDFSISFLSKWFSKVGFQKPQTRCKFGDFFRYMINVCGFKQVNIVMPPRVQKAAFFINCRPNAPRTYIYQNIIQIEQIHLKAKQQYKQQRLIRLQPLPQQYRKKFICRYYMSGNCQFTEEQCRYAHSITQLKYQFGQKFQLHHKQIVKSRQERLNYLSLYHYSHQKIDPNITLEQLNGNSNIRVDYRRRMHLNLYGDFMKVLQKQTGSQRIQLGIINREYNGAGFNHSQQNKFNQFESALWECGYLLEQIKFPQEKNKISYAYRVPPVEELDFYYSQQINQALLQEVEALKKLEVQNSIIIKQIKNQNQVQPIERQIENLNIDENNQNHLDVEEPKQLILQSTFRKKLYRNQEPFIIPLHVYLRIKNKTLQYVIKELVQDKNLLDHMFFQTNQQNFKKLIQMCKNFFKNKKDYIHKVENIEFYIKNLHKDQINLNGFVNFKSLLQSAVLDAGKKLYFLSFGNNSIVIDKGNLCLYQKTIVKTNYQLKNYQNKSQQNLSKVQSDPLNQLRIIIVDNEAAQLYAQSLLLDCNKFGVDLEGKLRKQGYIDLIQVSAIYNNKKQIFVFDIFVLQKMKNLTLYQSVKTLLKTLFQDPYRVKILHDCKQDSTALKYLMGIELKNVFDTSGMNIILEQKQIYENWNKKIQTNHHILKRICEVKTPGLNSVLDRWGAPNGVNIFKDSMKKLFHTQGTRAYFQTRPIDPEFLQYSAQDVQDLIDVYQNMKKQDTQKLSEFIGQLFSNYYQ